MCGIAGVFSLSALPHIEYLKSMTNSISHRGPDGEGHWCNHNNEIYLGHRRLSIIDLSDSGKQPMQYANNRYSITYNGEIYNYIELKSELVKMGYKFVSNSDTEVLLALYDNKKEKCLADLDGMFAFAIWDELEGKLFCARDRFGEKPFYYFYDENKSFYFASEMKALWSVGIEKKLIPSMVKNFVEGGSVVNANSPSTTFFQSIYQLEASHSLTISKNYFKPLVNRYYSLENITVSSKINFEDASNEFYFLLEKSIKRRLRSDVPVGTSLSGGIDSSSIVTIIDKLNHGNIKQKTFSARFKKNDIDEGKFINYVTAKCKSVMPLEIWPDKEELKSKIGEILYHQEEPFGSASIFAQWEVMKLAKSNGVSVLLDGQGADEQLAGYLYYYNLYLSQLYQNNYRQFKSEVHSYEKLRQTNYPLHPRNQSFKMKMGIIKRKINNKSISIPTTHLNTALKNDMTVVGLRELLRYADRNSMAHSVEVRLPFLSHELVEFSFSLPDSFKLHGGWTKYILRNSMENILPPEIAWRIDKVAYETPQDSWLEGLVTLSDRAFVCQYFMDNSVLNSKIDMSSVSEWNIYLLSTYLK